MSAPCKHWKERHFSDGNPSGLLVTLEKMWSVNRAKWAAKYPYLRDKKTPCGCDDCIRDRAKR